jgi:hypothetical protein
MLPNGQGVLYTVTPTTGGLSASSIAVLDLPSGRLTTLLRGGSHAQFGPGGYLVFAAGGTLRAVGFDPEHSIVAGPASPLVSQVLTTATGAVEAALARDGTLVYVAGGAGSGSAQTLVWVDRQGHETPIPAPPHAYLFAQLSPDGSRVAVSVTDQNTYIWIWDLGRATLTRVTSDPANYTSPQWTPDRRRVVFASDRSGVFQCSARRRTAPV